jgi:RecG-like helicase
MLTQSPLGDIPIQFAKGVGPRRARLLEKLGVLTVEDALWFVPWRYDDRVEVLPIANWRIVSHIPEGKEVFSLLASGLYVDGRCTNGFLR